MSDMPPYPPLSTSPNCVSLLLYANSIFTLTLTRPTVYKQDSCPPRFLSFPLHPLFRHFRLPSQYPSCPFKKHLPPTIRCLLARRTERPARSPTAPKIHLQAWTLEKSASWLPRSSPPLEWTRYCTFSSPSFPFTRLTSFSLL